MKPGMKVYVLLLILLMSMADYAYANLICAATTTPVSRAVLNGHWENTADISFTCGPTDSTPTTEASITIYFSGLKIANSTTVPTDHNIKVVNTAGALGAALDVTRTDTGVTGVNQSVGLIAITIPAQGTPAGGTFVVQNVLLSLAGATTAGQSVSALANVLSLAGNVVLTGSPISLINQVRPMLNSTTQPPGLVQGTNPAQFTPAGATLPPTQTCNTEACLNAQATFAVTVSEDHIDSWRSSANYYSNGTGVTLNGTNVEFSFSGMLPTSFLSNCTLTASSGAVWNLTGSGVSGLVGPMKFVAELASGEDSAAIETLTLTCGAGTAAPAYSPGSSSTPASTPITVAMSIAPTGNALSNSNTATLTGGTPRYAAGTSVGPITVINFVTSITRRNRSQVTSDGL